MATRSAGLLLFRPVAGKTGSIGAATVDPPALEVLIGHMGGPFWARKDAGAWSIPKGEHGPDEDPAVAAVREFTEEIGSPPPRAVGPDLDLGEVRQSAKTIRVFARQGELDAGTIVSNTFQLELPKGSGRFVQFPEIDRAHWVAPDDARRLLVRAQVAFVDRLLTALARDAGPGH